MNLWVELRPGVMANLDCATSISIVRLEDEKKQLIGFTVTAVIAGDPHGLQQIDLCPPIPQDEALTLYVSLKGALANDQVGALLRNVRETRPVEPVQSVEAVPDQPGRMHNPNYRREGQVINGILARGRQKEEEEKVRAAAKVDGGH